MNNELRKKGEGGYRYMYKENSVTLEINKINLSYQQIIHVKVNNLTGKLMET